jgi:hypothetical protein
MRVQIAARQAANTRAEHAMKMELRGVEGMRDGMQVLTEEPYVSRVPSLVHKLTAGYHARAQTVPCSSP